MDSSKLKPWLRKWFWHFDEADFFYSKPRILNVANACFSPKMVYCNKKNNIIGNRHCVLKKRPYLAPRRICYDPINSFVVIKKINSLWNFTPICVFQKTVKVPLSSAWFQNISVRIKMSDYALCKMQWSLHNIIALVISIWLIFHNKNNCQPNCWSNSLVESLGQITGLNLVLKSLPWICQPVSPATWPKRRSGRTGHGRTLSICP